MNIEIDDQIN